MTIFGLTGVWPRIARMILGATFAVFGASLPAACAEDELIPVEAYGKLPAIQNPQLSPNGRRLSSIRSYKGQRILVVQTIDGSGEKPAFIATSSNARSNDNIVRYQWVNNARLLIWIEGLQYSGKRKKRHLEKSTRLIAVNRDGSNMMRIYGVGAGGWWRLVDTLPDDDAHILVTGDNSSFETNVHRLNVNTGGSEKILRGRMSVYNYKTDPLHEPRIRYQIDFGNRESKPYWRTSGSLNWRRVFKKKDDQDWDFISFTEDPDIILASRLNEKGWSELYRYSLSERKKRGLVYAFDGKEPGGVRVDPATGKLRSVTWTQDYSVEEFFDQDWRQLLSGVQSAFPGKRVEIIDTDRSENKFIIGVGTERTPTAYYLYSREDKKLSGIGSQYPLLDGHPGFEVRKITYTARDGLEIPAYLTVPAGAEPYKTVVLPHGGPIARDYMEFDYWAQFLASRGYAVLQPNYRGSSGLGEKFLEAGLEEWGRKMQDDIDDGARHLVDIGVAPNSNICIVGWSYGGYSALNGVVRQTGLYKCAVAGAAVTNVESWLELIKFKFGDREHDAIGHLKKDAKRIRRISPIHHAEKIKVPVLIIHGEYDARVGPDEGRKMAEALEAVGGQYRYVELAKGSHQLSRGENRLIFLQELEAFLAQHL